MDKNSTRMESKQKMEALKKSSSKRESTEKALKESEEKYRNILESIEDGYFEVDLSGSFTFFNDSMCRILGYSADELLGMNNRKYMNAENAKKIFQTFNKVFRTGISTKALDWQLIRKDYSTCFIETVVSLITDSDNNRIGFRGIARDVTEQKQARDQLKRSEEKYRNILESIEDGYYEVDLSGNFTFFNDSMRRILGYSADELLGMNNREYMDAENAKKIFQTFNKVFRTGIPTKALDWQLIRKDNSTCIVETVVSLIKDSDNNSIGFRGIARDVTEQKQARDQLKRSEEKYRSLVENIPDIIYSIDKSFKLTAVNLPATNFYGYEANELVGSDFSALVHPEDKTRVVNSFLDAIENRQKWTRGLQLRMISKDGVTHWVEINSHMQFDKDGNYLREEGVLRDITERKEAERELDESRKKVARLKKMEALGLLAGGVAHDLNNVLSGIVGYPELILMDLPENSKLRKPIMTIQESGHRAAAIVQDLLTVTRGVATVKEPLSLNAVVKEYLRSPEFKKLEQFHSAVTVKANLDEALLNIKGSQIHIRKAVMNLISNASEAVEGIGNVVISTANRYVDRPIKGYHDISTGEYAVLSVSDDGSGISSNDLERIFEPFYTKKVMGRSGTGLGLTVIWNTIQDHKGYIDVTSDENGTTFQLYFPATRDKLSNENLSEPIKDYKGNGETVLIIDDVDHQREITCKMLDRMGYKTKAISSGEEAVEYLKEHSADLILLDMIMDPGINGRETYARIKKIHPNQKAIIVSGFAETDEVKETIKLGAGRYIKKPFTFETIGMAIKEELGKQSSE